MNDLLEEIGFKKKKIIKVTRASQSLVIKYLINKSLLDKDPNDFLKEQDEKLKQDLINQSIEESI